ncbi:adenylate/guanylate cyclase domain-containing protein [Microvirga arabica]|uniref:adenylate/guanylate cyclase domain-containing protein n=1 Tax=Microvirga arabica TaxID=1128671 RepID=UPI001939E159|nr:adenylate/guanylate cyclase domain-containing protein [Microvirga arabica]MBM1169639.1 adenylate/guanylate cyclase domain-containing protein [Microvirga arabica]
MEVEVHYARSGNLRIAYQVIGNGPLDLVFVPGFISNLDHYWDEPTLAHFLSRLSSFSRLILFDKRGTGLSDRLGSLPTLEERMDDVRAVMDAVESKRAALFGISEGGAMSTLFAATYPERTQALVLYGAYGHFPSWVLPPDKLPAFLEMIEQDWGTGTSLKAFAPSKVSDQRFKRWWARFERLGASPSAVIALMQMNSEIDIRHILPAIRVPTLVLHRTGDPRVSVEAGRYLGAAISGAKYVELPGSDHVAWVGDVDRLTDEIEEFLTGARAVHEPDRVLATVLFTDIVESTKKAAELGDRRWQSLLEQHDQAIREELARYWGREIKTLGDGFLATFDGPARAVRCASAITETAASLGLEVRCGVHTGEIEIKGEDISGIAVHIAARIAALAGGGKVLVSRTVRDLVAGSGLSLEERGEFALKGLNESMRLYTLATGQGA